MRKLGWFWKWSRKSAFVRRVHALSYPEAAVFMFIKKRMTGRLFRNKQAGRKTCSNWILDATTDYEERDSNGTISVFVEYILP